MPIPEVITPVLDLRAECDYNAIPPGFLSGNQTVREVLLPISIREIGTRAFADCPNLEVITTNNGVKVIYNDAFANCPKLHTIYLSSMLRLVYGELPDIGKYGTTMRVWDKYCPKRVSIKLAPYTLLPNEEDWLLALGGLQRAWVPVLYGSIPGQLIELYGASPVEAVVNYKLAKM